MKGASACPAAAEKWETGGSGGLQEAGGVCPQQVSWGEVWGTTWEGGGGWVHGGSEPPGKSPSRGRCPPRGAMSRPGTGRSFEASAPAEPVRGGAEALVLMGGSGCISAPHSGSSGFLLVSKLGFWEMKTLYFLLLLADLLSKVTVFNQSSPPSPRACALNCPHPLTIVPAVRPRSPSSEDPPSAAHLAQ